MLIDAMNPCLSSGLMPKYLGRSLFRMINLLKEALRLLLQKFPLQGDLVVQVQCRLQVCLFLFTRAKLMLGLLNLRTFSK